jgi:hypothetical protein
MKRVPTRVEVLARWIGVFLVLVFAGCGNDSRQTDANITPTATTLSAKEVQSALNAAVYDCNAQSDDPSSFICSQTDQGRGIKLTNRQRIRATALSTRLMGAGRRMGGT